MQDSNVQSKRFWDFELHFNKNRRIFYPREITYFKRVATGCLIMHMFLRGKKYTRSAIVFVPDPEFKWSFEHNGIMWERVHTQSNPNHKIHLHRLKAPEGWVVKELLTTKSPSQDSGIYNLSLIYIDDPHHQWDI